MTDSEGESRAAKPPKVTAGRGLRVQRAVIFVSAAGLLLAGAGMAVAATGTATLGRPRGAVIATDLPVTAPSAVRSPTSQFEGATSLPPVQSPRKIKPPKQTPATVRVGPSSSTSDERSKREDAEGKPRKHKQKAEEEDDDDREVVAPPIRDEEGKPEDDEEDDD